MAEKEQTKEARIVQVATSTADMFELEDGTVVDTNGILLKIYNNILKIKTII